MSGRPASGRVTLAAVALLAMVALAYTWATWRYFTLPIAGGNDFLTHYSAWDSYLRHGLNPYSDEAALRTQMAIYGRPARSGEDQNRMVYPFYSILVHGPFVFVDYAVARALYMTLLQAALLCGVIMMFEVLVWRPPLWMRGCVIAWSVLYYPEARGIILGQFAIFGFFALAGALYLLRAGRDTAAGAVLVLATVKPTLVFLVVPLLLLWAAAGRRWRFVATFGLVLLALSLASLLLLPSWPRDWLLRVRQYSGYTVGQSPVWLVTHTAWPALGTVGEVTLVCALLSLMLFAWWRALRSRPESADFHWALGLTLVVSNLVVPRSATTNYVLMLAPTLWILSALDRRGRPGRAAVLGLLLFSLVGYWWLHLATVVGNQEQPLLFLPWPLAL
jgi:hypothetical protein